MKWLAAPSLACAFGGCGSVFDLEPVDDPQHVDALGGYAKTLTLSQPTAATLTDFAVSVSLADDSDLRMHVLDGTEIGFVLANERLPCEVVRFDAEAGTLDAWVRIPSLPPFPNTLEVELVYGIEGAPCLSTEMWAGPEVGIWHGELANDRMLDSTPHGHDVVQLVQDGAPLQEDGLIGHALHYDGVDDALCEGVDQDGSLAFGTASFSYSAWILAAETTSSYDQPFYKGGSTVSTAGYQLSLGGGDWRANLSDANGVDTLRVEFAAQPALGDWHYLAVTVDRERDSVVTYLDGIARNTAPLTGWGSFSSTSPLCIGNTMYRFSGLIDETRVVAGALEPDRIAVEYVNGRYPDQLLAVGGERVR